MVVQVNTDNNITGSERLNKYVSDLVTDSLDRFSDQITRVEVHLGDENGSKEGGNDKRCMIEAHPAGMKAVAVTAHSNSIEQAINDAINKSISALDKVIGRLNVR